MLFDFDYPRVKQSLGKAALHEPYPAWFLNQWGIIQAANLMAFWLWNIDPHGERFAPESILGTNGFTLLANLIERIPVEQNVELYTKRAAVVKRLAAKAEKPYYSGLISAMKANDRLAHIYEQAPLDIENEWEYPLKITTPGQDNRPDGSNLLEFQVSYFRLVGDSGLLVTCYPRASCLSEVEAEYNRLRNQPNADSYVISLPETGEGQQKERMPLPTGLTNTTRVYYPALVQDALWYIVNENKAHRLITGGSMVGVHFFELFFAPQLKKWMEPIQETSAPRAVKYFDAFTSQFLRVDHELHDEFEQVMQRLEQIPGFCELLELSRKLSIHINVPQDYNTTFYTCRVILPWHFSPDITMQFHSMVCLIQQEAPRYRDDRYYQVVLVPENYETDVALLLLYLASTTEQLAEASSLKQYLWLLTILKTVREGLTRNEKEGKHWEPEKAFHSFSQQLSEQYAAESEETIADVIDSFRAIVAELDSKGMVNRNLLLIMLQGMAASLPQTQHLSAFLTQERSLTAVKVTQ